MSEKYNLADNIIERVAQPDTDVEMLDEDGGGAESELEDSGHIPAETSRRLACDCSIGMPLQCGDDA